MYSSCTISEVINHTTHITTAIHTTTHITTIIHTTIMVDNTIHIVIIIHITIVIQTTVANSNTFVRVDTTRSVGITTTSSVEKQHYYITEDFYAISNPPNSLAININYICDLNKCSQFINLIH